MSKKLTKFDAQILGYLYNYTQTKPKRKRQNFFEKLSYFFDIRKDLVKHTSLDKPISKSRFAINKAKLIRILKNKEKVLRLGYITKNTNKILLGVALDKTKRTIIRGMLKAETLSSSDENSIIIFKIESTELSIIGNRDRFLKTVNNYFRYKYAKEDRTLCQTEPDKKLADLVSVTQRDNQIYLYKIQYNDIEGGKKLRVRAYSDSGSILDKFIKRNFTGGAGVYDLRQILSLSFTNKKQSATLKITRLNENQYLLRWKNDNDLSNNISKLYDISVSDTLLIDSSNDKKLLNDLFRTERVDVFSIKNIYNRVLKEYSDYIELNRYNMPRLKYQNIYAKMRESASKLGYKIDVVGLSKRNGLYLPYQKNKTSYYKMLRISKDGKIVQHVLLNHEELYESGNEATIRKFFCFSPFIILDFRKNPKNEFKNVKDNDYTINSGEFLDELKNNPKVLLQMLTEQGKDIIEKFNLEDHYKIASELLDNIDKFNLKSQQKGALFEVVCFIILSKMFLTRKIGGSLRPDGKFIINNDKIVYDAKNLGSKTSFVKSVTRYGHIKDIDYINHEKASKYIYIATKIDEQEFIKVKGQIEATAPTCTVSVLTTDALKDLVKLYNSDPRRIDMQKVEAILYSGSIVKHISDRDALIDETKLKNV